MYPGLLYADKKLKFAYKKISVQFLFYFIKTMLVIQFSHMITIFIQKKLFFMFRVFYLIQIAAETNSKLFQRFFEIV